MESYSQKPEKLSDAEAIAEVNEILVSILGFQIGRAESIAAIHVPDIISAEDETADDVDIVAEEEKKVMYIRNVIKCLEEENYRTVYTYLLNAIGALEAREDELGPGRERDFVQDLLREIKDLLPRLPDEWRAQLN